MRHREEDPEEKRREEKRREEHGLPHGAVRHEVTFFAVMALLGPTCASHLAVSWHPDYFVESEARDSRFFALGRDAEPNLAYPILWPYFDGWSLSQYDSARYRLLSGYIGGFLTVRAPIDRGSRWGTIEDCEEYGGFCDTKSSAWCVNDEEWYWVNRANGAWGRPFMLPLSESPPVGDYQTVWFIADRIPLERGQDNRIEIRRREIGCAPPVPSAPDGTVVARTRIAVDPDLIVLPADVYVFGIPAENQPQTEEEVLGWFGRGRQHTWTTYVVHGNQCRIRGSCYQDDGRAWFRSVYAEREYDAGRMLSAYKSLFFDRMGERIDLLWSQCGIQFDPVVVHFVEGDATPPDCLAAREEMIPLVRPGRINVGVFESWVDSVGCSFSPPVRVSMTTRQKLREHGHWSHGFTAYGRADEMTNEILAHEIGHNLWLHHEDPPVTAPDGRWNLMWPSVDAPYGGTRLVAEQCTTARSAAAAILAEASEPPAKVSLEVNP